MASLSDTICEETVSIILLALLLICSEVLGSTERTPHNAITSVVLERIRSLKNINSKQDESK